MRRVRLLLACLMLVPAAPALAQTLGSGDVSNGTTQATGSTTPRKLSDRAADQLNAKDFGARGDGVTDDAAAIQAAMNAAVATSGNVLIIPRGTYKVSQPLVCPSTVGAASKLTIEGAGAAATIIKPFAATSALFSISTAYCDVRGITFNQDDASQLAQRAILINKPVNNSPIHLDDLNFNKGSCATCSFSTADIEVQNGDRIWFLRNHHVGANNGTAILFSQVNGNSFDDQITDLYVLGESGVDLNCSGINHAEGVTITNAHIYPSTGGTFGVRAQCGNALTLINSFLGQNNLGSGLIVDATNHPVANTTVIAGWQDGSGQSAGSVNGIRVLGAVHGVTVTGGNRTEGMHGYGIYVDGGTLLLNTNASTAAGNAVLNFASTTGNASTGNAVTPCGITWLVSDVTTPAAIPANTSVSACSSTSITMSANAAGAGVGNGDQIKLWQHASEVTITANQLGLAGGAGPNLAGDLYLNNVPGASITSNTFGSTVNVVEAGDTTSMTVANLFKANGTLTRNAASQWAFNSNSNADGLQLAGVGAAPTVGGVLSSGAGVLTFGEQGITVAGSAAATNAVTQVSSAGSGSVQLMSGGAVRMTAGNAANGGLIYKLPFADGNYLVQNFNTTGTFTFGNGVTSVLNNAGASVAAATTVTMPASANVFDGMILRVLCGNGLASVTWAANAGQTMVAGGSTACPGGTAATFFYQLAATTWFKTS